MANANKGRNNGKSMNDQKVKTNGYSNKKNPTSDKATKERVAEEKPMTNRKNGNRQ